MRMWGITKPCVPDAFTLGNASCGAISLLVLVGAGYAEDVWAGLSTLQLVSLLLVLGTVFDSLDGATARRFGGSSLGGQLDSLSDGITFGLVPAALLVTIALAGGGSGLAVAVAVAGFLVYLSGALLRLADFCAVRDEDTDFVGLPSPLAALLAVSAAYTTVDPLLLGLVLLVVGSLMVSRLRFPHQGRDMLPLAIGGWVLAALAALDAVQPTLVVAATWVLVLLVLPVLAARSRGRADDDEDVDADREVRRGLRLRLAHQQR